MHVFLAPVSFEEKYSSFDDLVVYDKIALTRAFKLIYLLSKIFNLFPALRSINSSHSSIQDVRAAFWNNHQQRGTIYRPTGNLISLTK